MSIESSSTASRLEEFESHLKQPVMPRRFSGATCGLRSGLLITLGGSLSPLSRPIPRSATTSYDGSFDVGVGGTDGIRVMFSNGGAATELP
jgi:hypothetical protein